MPRAVDMGEPEPFALYLHFVPREGRAFEDLSPLDLSQALYDFSLVYEVGVLTSMPEFEGYRFDNFFLRGRNRPVPHDVHLHLKTVRYGSPFEVLGFIPEFVTAAGGAFAIARAIEWAYSIDVRLRTGRLEQRNRYKRALLEEDRLDRELKRREEVRTTLVQLSNRIERQPLELEAAELKPVSERRTPRSQGPEPRV
jgi:hypothetical protein